MTFVVRFTYRRGVLTYPDDRKNRKMKRKCLRNARINVAGEDTVAAYSIREFCSRYRVGRSLVYDEIQSGRLRMRKVGRGSLIMRQDAEAWAERLPDGMRPA